MRTIKFRFWSGKKMFYSIDEVMECLKQQMHFNDYPAYKLGYDHVGLYGSSFMQFTGLHDKNGKEIYEGDKIEIPSINNYDFVNGIHIVYWDNNRAGWYLKRADEVDYTDVDMNDLSLFNYANSSNLIGNIHELL